MVENNRILEEISANIRKKAKSAKKWLRSKIAANRAGFFSHYHFHALQSNLRFYCTKPINYSAELITIFALRLNLEAFRIDYETCYTLFVERNSENLNVAVRSRLPYTRTIGTGLQIVGILRWVLNKLVSVFAQHKCVQKIDNLRK